MADSRRQAALALLAALGVAWFRADEYGLTTAAMLYTTGCADCANFPPHLQRQIIGQRDWRQRRRTIHAAIAGDRTMRGRPVRGRLEAPLAYKDVASVVDAADQAGLARKVARLRPLVCVKG